MGECLGSQDRQQRKQPLSVSGCVGRVPGACGYSFGTSPKPSAWSDSAGYKPSTSVFNLSLAPVGLSLSALSPFILPIRFWVAYLLAADKYFRLLLIGLDGGTQPVSLTQNEFSKPRACLMEA
jgi:hypothetical protein